MVRHASIVTELRQRVAQTIAHHCMVAPGEIVLAGVSGGQDSSALLDILADLRRTLGFELVVAHLDHGLRGVEGALAAESTREFAETLGCSCIVEKKNPGEIFTGHPGGLEEAAREVRWEFLERTAYSVGASRIALGHTRDDRIETMLLNLLRGSGIEGLASMRAVSGARIRPLLEVSRSETAAYCAARSIRIQPDSTNEDLRIRRNWVRRVLLPTIEKVYSPAVRETLARTAQLAEEESNWLAELGAEALRRCLASSKEGLLAVDRERLALEPMALRRRVVRAAFACISGNTRHLTAAAVETALRAERGSWSVPGSGVTIVSEPRRILFRRTARAASSPLVESTPLIVPGVTAVEPLGIRVEACEEKAPAQPPDNQQTWSQVLDLDQVTLPLVIRSRRPGDRIRPIGSPGSRKLQDIFVDRRVPAACRDQVPVVADARGPIWVVGHCLDARVRLRPETRRVLRLTVAKLDGDREGVDFV